MRHTNLSQLAECGAVGLLAAQVRVCLERYVLTSGLTEVQRGQIVSARAHVRSALEGLSELKRFRSDPIVTQDKLDDVLTFRATTEAFGQRDAQTLDQEGITRLESLLNIVEQNLASMLAGTELTLGAVKETDGFFDNLSDYYITRRQEIVAAGPESISSL